MSFRTKTFAAGYHVRPRAESPGLRAGIKNIISRFIDKVSRLFDFAKRSKNGSFGSGRAGYSENSKFNIFRRFNFKKVARPVAIVGLSIVLLYVLTNFVNRERPAQSTERVEVMGAKAEEDINKEFVFPLRGSEGEEISKIKYVVEKAELRDEIVVQGQKATAVKGRTFLIVTLKITNEYNQSIQIDTKDYVRLSVNGNEDDWLAPDIHNDPVEVQAISTKYTRLGFPMDDGATQLKLRVGEIDEEKEVLDLDL